MFKASELKNQQEITRTRDGVVFTVVSNHLNDVLFLCDTNARFYTGYHLFYDDFEDVVFARDEFNIDLTAEE